MRLTPVQIFDRGVANQERIYFRVVLDTNLAYYIVFDTRRIGTNLVANVPNHVYWFPGKDIRMSDHVVLYTGPGAPLGTETTNPDGTRNHIYYWGLSSTIWQDPNSLAVVFEIAEWQSRT